MVIDLKFQKSVSVDYDSESQKIRVMSEDWVGKNIYCPKCGKSIYKYKNGKPVADFYCDICKEDYELKSKKNSFGNKVVDGAYNKMIERLSEIQNPNFFFLNYNPINFSVINFMVVPKQFFIPSIIEKRKPLPKNAKRAGWIGCNILLNSVPSAGRIFYIKDSQIQPKNFILKNWEKISFIKQDQGEVLSGWLFDVMKCIDSIGKKVFSLNDVYRYEDMLKELHPENNHVKDKIRQQLQYLRDKGYLSFKGKGEYILK